MEAIQVIEEILSRVFKWHRFLVSLKAEAKLSNENWKIYGKMRYRVEQLFGSIKQKIGSSFKLLREDLARKVCHACAILWNSWVLASYLLWIILFS